MTRYVMIVVYVPLEHTEAVRAAMCDAGAGTVGDGRYDRVTYVSPCLCKYRVLGEDREVGAVGQEHESKENRIESICAREKIEAVIKAIVAAHPYKTPAIAVYPTLTGEYKYWES